jgi:hypothetical protein
MKNFCGIEKSCVNCEQSGKCGRAGVCDRYCTAPDILEARIQELFANRLTLRDIRFVQKCLACFSGDASSSRRIAIPLERGSLLTLAGALFEELPSIEVATEARSAVEHYFWDTDQKQAVLQKLNFILKQ